MCKLTFIIVMAKWGKWIPILCNQHILKFTNPDPWYTERSYILKLGSLDTCYYGVVLGIICHFSDFWTWVICQQISKKTNSILFNKLLQICIQIHWNLTGRLHTYCICAPAIMELFEEFLLIYWIWKLKSIFEQFKGFFKYFPYI